MKLFNSLEQVQSFCKAINLADNDSSISIEGKTLSAGVINLIRNLTLPSAIELEPPVLATFFFAQHKFKHHGFDLTERLLNSNELPLFSKIINNSRCPVDFTSVATLAIAYAYVTNDHSLTIDINELIHNASIFIARPAYQKKFSEIVIKNPALNALQRCVTDAMVLSLLVKSAKASVKTDAPSSSPSPSPSPIATTGM